MTTDVDEQTRTAMARRALPRRQTAMQDMLSRNLAGMATASDPSAELATVHELIADLSSQTLALQHSDEGITAALNQVDQKYDRAITALKALVTDAGDSLAERLTSRVFILTVAICVALLGAGFTGAMNWVDVFNKLLIAAGTFSGVEGVRDTARALREKDGGA